MSFEDFKSRVENLIAKACENGGKIEVLFSQDGEGRYFAATTEGIRIVGNKYCKRVMVNWGSGHSGLATI